ncbi:MAG: hypothetical protein IKD64_09005 [Lachnospiraceae bacterium]|nr:hypothetical protein [Lachnospiraceae bacterium]
MMETADFNCCTVCASKIKANRNVFCICIDQFDDDLFSIRLCTEINVLWKFSL